MGPPGRDAWSRRLRALRAGPASPPAGPDGGDPGGELLSELRGERLSEAAKVSLLALSLEFAAQLWPDAPAAEDAAARLLDALLLLPPRPSALRRPLLLAATAALAAGDALTPRSEAAARLLPLLLGLAAGRDPGPGLGPASERRALRATACECLRELESCRPGLLRGCLGLLRGALAREGPVQPLGLLLALALRGALSGRAGAGVDLRGLLEDLPAGAAPWSWAPAEDVDPGRALPRPLCWPDSEAEAEAGPCGLAGLELGPEEARELRAVVTQLLDASYLLAPAAQAQLLWLLGWTLRGLRSPAPALFKPQLVRLLGTAQVTLLHAVLGLKAAFGEALFTAQDEALLLRRLALAAQHPALSPPEHLFYLHCLLRFPENCPLDPAGEEAAPLLLTPALCRGLLPSLLQDPPALLARLQLLCLLCSEEGAEEAAHGLPGRFLQELLAGLRERAALDRGPRASATVCFQASYLVVQHLAGHPSTISTLTCGLARLYGARPALAPHFVDLLKRGGPELGEPLRAELRQEVLSRPGGGEALHWHLQMLAEVAEPEAQGTILRFLRAAAPHCADWGLQQALLRVCRALLRAGVRGSLADLLQALAGQLADPDARDHARLYYVLLAHLSAPKLAAALAPSLATPALTSSLVAENQGFAESLMVREAPTPPLRLSPGPRRAEGAAPVLQLQVEALESVFSLELRFHAPGQLYGPLPALHLPCLRPDRPTCPLRLPLQPLRPVPASLEVRALYTTAAGLTCHTRLPALQVSLADLFLPFPQLPDGDGEGPRFFQELWDSCLPGGAESRLWCPLGPEGLEAWVSRHLQPFVVAARAPASYHVAIRLPPDSKLLLRLEAAQAEGVPVALRTDDWTVLPLAGDYLRGLSAAA